MRKKYLSSADKDPAPDFLPPKHLQAMHQAILRHFVETGQAPTATDLAKTLAHSLAEIEALLVELAAVCLYCDPVSKEILCH